MSAVQKFSWHGEELSLVQISKRTGIHSETLRKRVASGKTIEQATAIKPMNARQAGQMAKKSSPWSRGFKQPK